MRASLRRKLQSGTGYCALEFGNVSGGFGLNTYGKDAQYGTDQSSVFGYPQFIGALHTNPCANQFGGFLHDLAANTFDTTLKQR